MCWLNLIHLPWKNQAGLGRIKSVCVARFYQLADCGNSLQSDISIWLASTDMIYESQWTINHLLTLSMNPSERSSTYMIYESLKVAIHKSVSTHRSLNFWPHKDLFLLRASLGQLISHWTTRILQHQEQQSSLITVIELFETVFICCD